MIWHHILVHQSPKLLQHTGVLHILNNFFDIVETAPRLICVLTPFWCLNSHSPPHGCSSSTGTQSKHNFICLIKENSGSAFRDWYFQIPIFSFVEQLCWTWRFDHLDCPEIYINWQGKTQPLYHVITMMSQGILRPWGLLLSKTKLFNFPTKFGKCSVCQN